MQVAQVDSHLRTETRGVAQKTQNYIIVCPVIEFNDAFKFIENAATRPRRLDAGPGARESSGAREPPRAAQRSGARKST